MLSTQWVRVTTQKSQAWETQSFREGGYHSCPRFALEGDIILQSEKYDFIILVRRKNLLSSQEGETIRIFRDTQAILKTQSGIKAANDFSVYMQKCK